MFDAALTQRIRAIFLHREPHVTIAEAAGILGWSHAQMNAAIRNGEIVAIGTGGGKAIETRELAAWALQQRAVTTIEEALGRDAARILPPPLRSRRFVVRLPVYHIGELKVRAEEAREPIDGILTRAVEDSPEFDRHRLSRLVSGFAEATSWSCEWNRGDAFDVRASTVERE